MKKRNKESGQSLVEYLIIVSVVAIGSIAIIRTMGQTIKVRYANITNALQNKESSDISTTDVKESDYKRSGLDDFFKGASGSADGPTLPGGSNKSGGPSGPSQY
jgi:Flp pilus assembly pilin Flp